MPINVDLDIPDCWVVDADSLVYRSGFGSNDSLKGSLGNLNRTIATFEYDLKYPALAFFITSNDQSNFRFKTAKTKPYKANRIGNPKPTYYKELREYLQKHYSAEVVSHQEADDMVGILQSDGIGIVHVDKDINQVPGHHYNFVTKELYYITDADSLNYQRVRRKSKKTGKKYWAYKMDRGGIKWFYAQMLLGDTSDNIPGVESYGLKATYELLNDCTTEQELFKIVWGVYNKKGLSLERFLEVADLLWIRRTKNQVKSEELKQWHDQVVGLQENQEKRIESSDEIKYGVKSTDGKDAN